MFVAVLGQAALLLAAVVALGGSVACFLGGHRLMARNAEQPAVPGAQTQQRWADLGLAAPRALLVLVAGAAFLLLLALVGRDYTLAYVQGRISNDLPLGFRLTALWSGQQGSLLLWLLVLASCGVMMVRSLRRAHLPAALVSYATGALLTVATFFAVLVAFVARPFEVVGQLASDGAGMSPSLQNYWMAAHPPSLYLGYVGVTVPFAIVVGALLAKRRDDAWVGALRGWVLFSWVCLSLGLVLGARWAYEEIGWGGYWAWDPVENAALMPWLTSTALLHSIMVQQRRGMMRFWNVVLASATFLLSIFGTFITRSGVLSSVHAFVSSPVGWWFIAALGVAAVATITLLYLRRDLLRAQHDVDSVVSREALLLFNNLLLVALMLVVLWGVVFPIMTAAFSSTRISLQEPWYDFFAAAFGLPLTAMLAFAPMIAWRGTPWRRVVRSMALPVGAAALTGGILAAAGAGSSPMSCAAVSLGVMVLAGIAIDLRRARSRRRIGAWIAHSGFALLINAIAGSGWSHRVERELTPGERVSVGAYQLQFERTVRARTSSTMQTRAVFDVTRGRDHGIGSLRAGRDFHPASGEASNEVAVHRDWLHAQDLFVTVDRITEDGTIQVVVLVNQMLPLLWLGGLITIVGALIVAVPGRRRTRPVTTDSTIPVRDDGNLPIRTGVGG
jgi:cytochrome c-type biogenesis protein CcmF